MAKQILAHRRPATGVHAYVVLLACALLAMALSAHAADYAVSVRSDIQGKDIDCGQKDSSTGEPLSYCEIYGGITAIADACNSNPKCKAFTMSGGYSGYLKSAASPTTYTVGYAVFCKPGTAGCSGDYTVTLRASISGHEVDCNYKDYNGQPQPYCLIQGGDYTAGIDACNANPDCKAFDLQDSGPGPYLKSATGPTTYTEGFNTFSRG